MGWLGGIVGTGLKSAIGAGAAEYKVLTSQEEKEPGFKEKENYKSFLAELTKDRNAYLTAEAENLNFGRRTHEDVYFPDDTFFYRRNRYEYSIPTKNAETYADQVQNMKAFKILDNVGYENLTDDEKMMVNSSVEDMGRQAVFLNTHDINRTRKEGVRTGLKWDTIFPEMPQWFRDTLHGRIKNYTEKEENNVVTQEFVEEAVLDPVSPVGSPLYPGMDERGYGTEQMHQKYSEQVINYAKRKHPSLAVEPKDMPHLEKKYELSHSNFPQLQQAASPLVDIYLPPSLGGKANKVYAYYPSVSKINAAYDASIPHIYSSLIGQDINNPRVHENRHAEEFHSRSIEVFESLITNDELYYLTTGMDPNELGYDHIEKLGLYSANDYRKDVVDASLLKIHTDKAQAWNIWKQVHESLLYEFQSPLALGGKGYEFLASLAHITTSGNAQWKNVLTMLRADSRSKPFAEVLERIGSKFLPKNVAMEFDLTEGDKDWIMGKDNTIKRDQLTTESMREAYASMYKEDGSFDKEKYAVTPPHLKLLASVAKQRSLTLMGTYLAAAIIQGEGGKAISDHDQKLTEKILQYGFFTTPQQRIASLNAVHDILATQGVISDRIANANRAETIWAALEYQKVARSRDILEANIKYYDGKGQPEFARKDIFPVDENGDLLPYDNSGVLPAGQVDSDIKEVAWEMSIISEAPEITHANRTDKKAPLKITNKNISGYLGRYSGNNPKKIISEKDLNLAFTDHGWVPTAKDLEIISIDADTNVIKYKE